jgi:hypothetical protein
MKTEYIVFVLVLGNGEKCRIRYCDKWGASMFGNRTVQFEFLDCLSISNTKYKSEFRVVEENEKFDPEDTEKKIIEELTGIKVSGEKVQQRLL